MTTERYTSGPQTATKGGLQISGKDIEKIIRQGDARLTVQYAQEIGERLATQLTTSQIRNVFTTVRQIEMSWPVQAKSAEEAKSAMRQLVLLKPKLAYQASREQRGGRGMARLRDILIPAIDLVETREHFQNFVDFLEAILAYHTAAGDR